MTPPVESWPVAELEQRIYGNAKGEYRKGFDGNLKNCQLMELLQYNCKVDNPESKNSLVRCWPVERLFRRCKDKSGTFTVETTAWEGGGKTGG